MRVLERAGGALEVGGRGAAGLQLTADFQVLSISLWHPAVRVAHLRLLLPSCDEPAFFR